MKRLYKTQDSLRAKLQGHSVVVKEEGDRFALTQSLAMMTAAGDGAGKHLFRAHIVKSMVFIVKSVRCAG